MLLLLGYSLVNFYGIGFINFTSSTIHKFYTTKFCGTSDCKSVRLSMKNLNKIIKIFDKINKINKINKISKINKINKIINKIK